MRPVYRQALDVWERGDDDVMQTTEVAQIRREVREEAAGIAELGCREAASALDAGDEERIYAVVTGHGTTIAARDVTSQTSHGRGG